MYQARFMKMIFESVLLDKVQEQFIAEKEKITIDTTSEGYQAAVDRKLNEVTFEFYKVFFFNFLIKKRKTASMPGNSRTAF
jgi:hypothetical protein